MADKTSVPRQEVPEEVSSSAMSGTLSEHSKTKLENLSKQLNIEISYSGVESTLEKVATKCTVLKSGESKGDPEINSESINLTTHSNENKTDSPTNLKSVDSTSKLKENSVEINTNDPKETKIISESTSLEKEVSSSETNNSSDCNVSKSVDSMSESKEDSVKVDKCDPKDTKINSETSEFQEGVSLSVLNSSGEMVQNAESKGESNMTDPKDTKIKSESNELQEGVSLSVLNSSGEEQMVQNAESKGESNMTDPKDTKINSESNELQDDLKTSFKEEPSVENSEKDLTTDDIENNQDNKKYHTIKESERLRGYTPAEVEDINEGIKYVKSKSLAYVKRKLRADMFQHLHLQIKIIMHNMLDQVPDIMDNVTVWNAPLFDDYSEIVEKFCIRVEMGESLVVLNEYNCYSCYVPNPNPNSEVPYLIRRKKIDNIIRWLQSETRILYETLENEYDFHIQQEYNLLLNRYPFNMPIIFNEIEYEDRNSGHEYIKSKCVEHVRKSYETEMKKHLNEQIKIIHENKRCNREITSNLQDWIPTGITAKYKDILLKFMFTIDALDPELIAGTCFMPNPSNDPEVPYLVRRKNTKIYIRFLRKSINHVSKSVLSTYNRTIRDEIQKYSSKEYTPKEMGNIQEGIQYIKTKSMEYIKEYLTNNMKQHLSEQIEMLNENKSDTEWTVPKIDETEIIQKLCVTVEPNESVLIDGTCFTPNNDPNVPFLIRFKGSVANIVEFVLEEIKVVISKTRTEYHKLLNKEKNTILEKQKSTLENLKSHEISNSSETTSKSNSATPKSINSVTENSDNMIETQQNLSSDVLKVSSETMSAESPNLQECQSLFEKNLEQIERESPAPKVNNVWSNLLDSVKLLPVCDKRPLTQYEDISPKKCPQKRQKLCIKIPNETIRREKMERQLKTNTTTSPDSEEKNVDKINAQSEKNEVLEKSTTEKINESEAKNETTMPEKTQKIESKVSEKSPPENKLPTQKEKLTLQQYLKLKMPKKIAGKNEKDIMTSSPEKIGINNSKKSAILKHGNVKSLSQFAAMHKERIEQIKMDSKTTPQVTNPVAEKRIEAKKVQETKKPLEKVTTDKLISEYFQFESELLKESQQNQIPKLVSVTQMFYPEVPNSYPPNVYGSEIQPQMYPSQSEIYNPQNLFHPVNPNPYEIPQNFQPPDIPPLLPPGYFQSYQTYCQNSEPIGNIPPLFTQDRLPPRLPARNNNSKNPQSSLIMIDLSENTSPTKKSETVTSNQQLKPTMTASNVSTTMNNTSTINKTSTVNGSGQITGKPATITSNQQLKSTVPATMNKTSTITKPPIVYNSGQTIGKPATITSSQQLKSTVPVKTSTVKSSGQTIGKPATITSNQQLKSTVPATMNKTSTITKPPTVYNSGQIIGKSTTVTQQSNNKSSTIVTTSNKKSEETTLLPGKKSSNQNLYKPIRSQNPQSKPQKSNRNATFYDYDKPLEQDGVAISVLGTPTPLKYVPVEKLVRPKRKRQRKNNNRRNRTTGHTEQVKIEEQNRKNLIKFIDSIGGASEKRKVDQHEDKTKNDNKNCEKSTTFSWPKPKMSDYDDEKVENKNSDDKKVISEQDYILLKKVKEYLGLSNEKKNLESEPTIETIPDIDERIHSLKQSITATSKQSETGTEELAVPKKSGLISDIDERFQNLKQSFTATSKRSEPGLSEKSKKSGQNSDRDERFHNLKTSKLSLEPDLLSGCEVPKKSGHNSDRTERFYNLKQFSTSKLSEPDTGTDELVVPKKSGQNSDRDERFYKLKPISTTSKRSSSGYEVPPKKLIKISDRDEMLDNLKESFTTPKRTSIIIEHDPYECGYEEFNVTKNNEIYCPPPPKISKNYEDEEIFKRRDRYSPIQEYSYTKSKRYSPEPVESTAADPELILKCINSIDKNLIDQVLLSKDVGVRHESTSRSSERSFSPERRGSQSRYRPESTRSSERSVSPSSRSREDSQSRVYPVCSPGRRRRYDSQCSSDGPQNNDFNSGNQWNNDRGSQWNNNQQWNNGPNNDWCPQWNNGPSNNQQWNNDGNGPQWNSECPPNPAQWNNGTSNNQQWNNDGSGPQWNSECPPNPQWNNGPNSNNQWGNQQNNQWNQQW